MTPVRAFPFEERLDAGFRDQPAVCNLTGVTKLPTKGEP